jgi:tRNA (guanine-N(7)-)-methyltransferase subunit TRM82
MKIPYNCLHARGGVLFGARGGKIHTFSLADGAHIAAWKHPELETCTAAGSEAPTTVENEAERVGGSAMVDEAEQPPSKRQKVADDDAPKNMDDEDEAGGKRTRSKEHRKPKPIPVPDRPVIIQLTTTADGSHLVAVSAHDKAVWVFSHNGSGQLTQLSKR